jgi:hypothetical protein
VLIADWANQRVRVIADATGTFYGKKMTAGHIYIVGVRGATLDDGGPATRALLSYPFAVALSPTGSLLVTDAQRQPAAGDITVDRRCQAGYAASLAWRSEPCHAR